MEETSVTQTLSVELEKLSTRIEEELMNFLVNLDGSLKGIDSGILIKIPLGAGYVSFSSSESAYEMRLWTQPAITREPEKLVPTKSTEI